MVYLFHGFWSEFCSMGKSNECKNSGLCLTNSYKLKKNLDHDSIGIMVNKKCAIRIMVNKKHDEM